jgi:hypothetical protein
MISAISRKPSRKNFRHTGHKRSQGQTKLKLCVLGVLIRSSIRSIPDFLRDLRVIMV